MKKSFLQLIKFGLIGILNTLVDIAVFYVLNTVFGIYYIVANVISFSCGVINSYFFNSRWTFKTENNNSKKQFFLFVLVNTIALLTTTLSMFLLKNYVFTSDLTLPLFGWNIVLTRDTMSKLISVIVTISTSFIGNKLLVFKEKSAEK